MSLSRVISHRPAALAASVALCTGAVVTSTAATAAQAHAVESTVPITLSRAGAAPAATTGSAALAAAPRAATTAAAISAGMVTTAATLAGRPYRWGAAGPSAFDCSGYTRYVYARSGISIPRTAQQQYRAAHVIAKSAIRPGDLVFFVSHGYAYHVAIYAGNGMIWHAPHSGSSVRRVKIWTSSWVAGRFL